MKILFVHDHFFKYQDSDYFSNGGFPANIWQRYLSVFNNLTVVGRDGGYLSPADRGYTLSSCRGVSFRLLPNISNIRSLLFGNKIVVSECRRLVSESDGIIARLPSRLGQLFVKEAIRQAKPYAIEVVGCAWDALWNYGDWKGKVMAPLAFYETKLALSRAPFALYVTQHFLQNRYPCGGKTTFCSNVEISDVNDDVLIKRSERIFSENEKIYVGLIGNYSSKYKGIDAAIRALALLDAELNEWELQVLGSGDFMPFSKLADSLGVGEKVKFIGSLPSGLPVYNWLDSIDIYLQPSLTEGLPRALIEAMSRGCPGLGSNVGGIPELLPKSQMIKPGDYKELAMGIKRLIKNNVMLRKTSEENFDKAKNYYKSALDARRGQFFNSFKEYIKSFD